MNMKHTCTYLPEKIEARSVLLLKIDNFSVTPATIGNSTDCINSRCVLDGYDWEIRFYPSRYRKGTIYFLALELVFLGGGRPRAGAVTATLSGRLVDNRSYNLAEFKTPSKTTTFRSSSDRALVYIASGDVGIPLLQATVPLTVECTILVVKDTEAMLPPSSPNDLHRHLGELLQSKIGADVTFAVFGESFAAHKNILAARSPVFKAEFFGAMAERSCQHVEIQDMEPAVFEAMLRFIYTDEVPAELDDKQQPEAVASGTVMLQHLLVAADRYGLDKLKVICEERLTHGMDIETAASTLSLAERHNCSGLKAKCIEFIAGRSAENLDAVMGTEGYRHLEASFPSVLTELLKAANARNAASTNSN